MVYFCAGLFGDAVSYLWLKPTGAGNSMAVAGLLGTLAVTALTAGCRYGIDLPRRLRTAALALPLLAVGDTLLHDNHGLPLLLDMGLGLVLLPRPRLNQRTTMLSTCSATSKNPA